jgi:hypothetical protein
MSRQPASTKGWLATMPIGLAVHTGKTNEDVFGVLGLQFEEIAIVNGFDESALSCRTALFGFSGTNVSKLVSKRSIGSPHWRTGAFSRLDSGK